MTETESEPPSRLIEIDGSHAGRSLDLGWLRTQLERAAELLPRPVSRVTIAILPDARMRELHRRHMGIDSGTDVLTFAASERSESIDADLAIGVDEAARQAAERGHAVERELLLYALHGLLHCCGHDDHDPDDFNRMHALEDRILGELGIGATFAGAESTCAPREGAAAAR
jgi:probable rRNA maturation factor